MAELPTRFRIVCKQRVILALAHSGGAADRSGCRENATAEQYQTGATERLAPEHLQPVDVACHGGGRSVQRLRACLPATRAVTGPLADWHRCRSPRAAELRWRPPGSGRSRGASPCPGRTSRQPVEAGAISHGADTSRNRRLLPSLGPSTVTGPAYADAVQRMSTMMYVLVVAQPCTASI
jgi:hypothetical protein